MIHRSVNIVRHWRLFLDKQGNSFAKLKNHRTDFYFSEVKLPEPGSRNFRWWTPFCSRGRFLPSFIERSDIIYTVSWDFIAIVIITDYKSESLLGSSQQDDDAHAAN